MLDLQLRTAVLSIPLTVDLRDLAQLIEAEIRTREAETGSTYTISDFAKAQTKVSVIRPIRVLMGCDLTSALRTYDQGELVCSPVTAEQRVALETLREIGCTVVKNK